MNHSQKILLSSSLILGSINPTKVIAQKEQKPNFLIIVCEDISPYIGCFGDSVAVTPNLDNFSKESIRHNNMFTCIGVSSPSRYSLITGRYATNDGANYMRANYFDKEFSIVAPKGVKCYTEQLRKQGYYCTNNSKTDFQFDSPLSTWDEQGNKAHWKNRPKGASFLSIFNLNITHESQIWKRSNKPLAVSPDKIILPPYYPDNDIVRHDMAVLYSNIKEMDSDFEKLLNELKETEEYKNTIIIFYSDNGGPMPRAKRELKDSGTKVPFMIHFPDNRGAGTIDSNLNMFVDIPSTLLSLANIKPASYMQGEAMYGKYKGKTRKYVFGATDRFDEQVEKRASIRDNQYLYIRNYMPHQSIYRPVKFRLDMPMMRNMLELLNKGELNDTQKQWFDNSAAPEELYDCTKDPHQINNLATHKEYKTLLNKMRKLYKSEWIDKYNGYWVNHTEKDFRKKMQPNGVTPQSPDPTVSYKNGKVTVSADHTCYSVSYQINSKGMDGKANHWILYSEPFDANANDKITIITNRIGYKQSKINYICNENKH